MEKNRAGQCGLWALWGHLMQHIWEQEESSSFQRAQEAIIPGDSTLHPSCVPRLEKWKMFGSGSPRSRSSPRTATSCWVMQNKGLFSELYFHGSVPALPLNPLPSKTDGEGQLDPGGRDVGADAGQLSRPLPKPGFLFWKVGIMMVSPPLGIIARIKKDVTCEASKTRSCPHQAPLSLTLFWCPPMPGVSTS